MELVVSDSETFVRLTEESLQERSDLDQEWNNLIRIILDLRKLGLDQTEIGLVDAMILTNGGQEFI